MSSRISRKQVESLVQQLNEATNRPLTALHTDDNGDYIQHPNHLYLEQFNDKYYRVAMMLTHGSTDIGSGGTLAEIEKYVRGMLIAIYGIPVERS